MGKRYRTNQIEIKSDKDFYDLVDTFLFKEIRSRYEGDIFLYTEKLLLFAESELACKLNELSFDKDKEDIYSLAGKLEDLIIESSYEIAIDDDRVFILYDLPICYDFSTLSAAKIHLLPDALKIDYAKCLNSISLSLYDSLDECFSDDVEGFAENLEITIEEASIILKKEIKERKKLKDTISKLSSKPSVTRYKPKTQTLINIKTHLDTILKGGLLKYVDFFPVAEDNDSYESHYSNLFYIEYSDGHLEDMCSSYLEAGFNEVGILEPKGYFIVKDKVVKITDENDSLNFVKLQNTISLLNQELCKL